MKYFTASGLILLSIGGATCSDLAKSVPNSALSQDMSVDDEIDDHESILCRSLCGNRQFLFKIKHNALMETPQWTDDPCPKCTPRTARAMALNWIRKHIPEDDHLAWKCDSLCLKRADDDIWYWIAECEVRVVQGGATGGATSFGVPVLMSGKIPEPQIGPLPDETDDDE